MELYALRYAESPYWENQLFAADPPPAFGTGPTIPFAWLFFLLKTDDGGIVLIDAGFHRRAILAAWNMERIGGQEFALRDIPQLLGTMGIAPQDVTDVVLTHADFDHAGGADLFPQATVHVQRDALARLRTAGELPEVAAFLDARPGALSVFDEEASVRGTLHLRLIGGHAQGSCVARIDRGSTTWLLLGDESYCLENAEDGKAVGYLAGDPAANAAFNRELAAFIRGIDPWHRQRGQLTKTDTGGRTTVFLPFHDPRVLTQFPTSGHPDIVRIA